MKAILLCSLIVAVLAVSFVAYDRLFKYTADVVGGSQYDWQSHGLGMGGRASKVTVDQKNPNIVYAGTDTAGVLKSTNGGESWALINHGLDDNGVGGVAVDYDNSNILYVTDGTGLYKSTDQGQNWVKKTTDIRLKFKGNVGSGSIQIVQSKSRPEVLYAISWLGHYYSSSLNSNNFTVYKSVDRGEAWVEILGTGQNVLPRDLVAPEKGVILRAIVVDPKNDQKVFVSGDNGLYQTADGGANWYKVTVFDEKINSLLGFDSQGQVKTNGTIGLICDQDISTNVFKRLDLETDQALKTRCVETYRDGPVDKAYSGSKDVRSITINPYNSNHLVVLSAWGHVYESFDGGLSWREVYHRDNILDPTSLGVVDTTKTIIWNDHDWYSFDSLVFNTSNPTRYGLRYETVKLDIDPNQANINLCQTDLESCRYYIYLNNFSGTSRKKTIWRIESNDIEYDAFTQGSTPCVEYTDASQRYCKTWAFLYRDTELWEVVLNSDSTGGDATRNDWPLSSFVDRFTEVDMFDLDFSSSYPNRTIYTVAMWGTAKGVASEKYKGPLKSTEDLVENYSYAYDWNWMYKGFENYGVTDLVFDSLNPNFIYFSAMDLGFIRSTDGGKTFSRSMKDIFLTPGDWCERNGESCVGGHGWRLATAVKDAKTVIYFALSSWNYYSGKIMKSLDNGESWQDISGSEGLATSLPPHIQGNPTQDLPRGQGVIYDVEVDPNNPERIIASIKNNYTNETACRAIYEAAGFSNIANQCDYNFEQNQTRTWVNAGGPIWMTENGGQTWQPISSGKANGLPESSWGHIAVDFANNTIYYGVHDYDCAETDSQCPLVNPNTANPLGSGIYKSTDWGQSWQKLNVSYDNKNSGQVIAISINPFDVSELFAVGIHWNTAETICDSYLIKSVDSGASWQLVKTLVSSDIAKINFDPYHQGRIAVSVNSYYPSTKEGPLYISFDGGHNWSNEKNNFPAPSSNAVAFHPVTFDKVVAAVSGAGLAWSYDPLSEPAATPTSVSTPTPTSTQKADPTPTPATRLTSTPTPVITTTSIPASENEDNSIQEEESDTVKTSTEDSPMSSPSVSKIVSPSPSEAVSASSEPVAEGNYLPTPSGQEASSEKKQGIEQGLYNFSKQMFIESSKGERVMFVLLRDYLSLLVFGLIFLIVKLFLMLDEKYRL